MVDDAVPTPSARDRLLEAAIRHLGEHGISDLSLRAMAGELGTSHRMLIYHFGSRDGLLTEIVQAVEARQRAALRELQSGPGTDPRAVARTFWRRLADPALAPHERLFFELYGRALQGRSYAASLLATVVDTWLEPLATQFGRADPTASPAAAAASGRLALAVARGLLLDLLATGDRPAVDAAFERYLDIAFPEPSRRRGR